VEFGVESGDAPTGGVVPVPRRVFQRLLSERPTPEQCVEAYYLQRTRFESLVNLIEGAHFMFRNPTAHEAPIKWNLCKEDAV
jgi:hypothetical protein